MPEIEQKVNVLGDIRIKTEDDSQYLSEDIAKVIHQKVDELQSQNILTPKVCKVVAEKLEVGADTTFLWISLVLKKIVQRESIKRSTVEEVLEGLPSDLDELYGMAFSSATERSH